MVETNIKILLIKNKNRQYVQIKSEFVILDKDTIQWYTVTRDTTKVERRRKVEIKSMKNNRQMLTTINMGWLY